MSGFNLPPGVSASMIPGNEPPRVRHARAAGTARLPGMLETRAIELEGLAQRLREARCSVEALAVDASAERLLWAARRVQAGLGEGDDPRDPRDLETAALAFLHWFREFMGKDAYAEITCHQLDALRRALGHPGV